MGPSVNNTAIQRWSFEELLIDSPKRAGLAPSGWEGFFPYYAGYPERFALEILRSVDLPTGATVLDPWNGSGTTTYAASQLGISSLGFDLNPVMLTVSRARLLPTSEADSIGPLAQKICAYDPHASLTGIADEPLSLWFDRLTATHFRAIEANVRAHLVGEMTNNAAGVQLENMSGLAATFYVALFSVARSLAADFNTTNPTWLKTAKEDDARIRVPRGVIVSKFLSALREMSNALTERKKMASVDPATARIAIADTTALALPKNSVDLVLTSPPYCTRIDYTAATRLELAMLAPLIQLSPKDLSRKMMGTTRVPTEPIKVQKSWGHRCVNFLDAVKTHSSKASEIYYYPTHLDYFNKLANSLSHISYAIKQRGKAVLVVQDSYYKEVHNPLPSIVEDIAYSCGLSLKRRKDFVLTHSMTGINPHAKKYRASRPIVESVLCFMKQ